MPTNRFVIDASAWIEYLDGTETGKSVIKIAEDNSTEVFTSAATVADTLGSLQSKDSSPGSCNSTIGSWVTCLTVLSAHSTSTTT